MSTTNKFEIGDVPADFALPTAKTTGRIGGSKYPFADLAVNQCFFVPNSAIEKGDAVKTMAQACSKANKTFGKPAVMEDGVTPRMRKTRTGTVQATDFVKVFKSGPYTKDGQAGALVTRTA